MMNTGKKDYTFRATIDDHDALADLEKSYGLEYAKQVCLDSLVSIFTEETRKLLELLPRSTIEFDETEKE